MDDPGFNSSGFTSPDTFFTINGLREDATDATADNIQYLNALWTDCDCHHLSQVEKADRLQALEESRLLPPTSLVIWSGRGVWLLWLLQGTAGLSTPPVAENGKRELHREIEREIACTLQAEFPELKADSKSTNVNRLTRLPGTLNSKSGAAVRWDVRNWNWLYRLEDWPRVGPKNSRPRSKKARPHSTQTTPINPAAYSAGERKPWTGRLPVARNPQGQVMRWEAELRDFLKLWELRGGFREGSRNNAAWLYAYMLRESWVEEEEILARVERLAVECQPPLSDDEWRASVRSSRGVRNPLTRLEIVARLAVTPDESEHLERWKDPQSQLRLDNEAATKERRKRHPAEERQRAIMTMVKERGGEIPPIRATHKMLKAAGIHISRNSVAKDYRTLGLT